MDRKALAPLPSVAELDAQILEAAATAVCPVLPDPPALKQRKIGKYLYLPVEIAGRELASRAKLAGDMARRGWQVVLGASWSMMHQRYGDLPPGIILFKTLNALDARGIFQAAQNGHITCCLNEELLVMPDEERLFRLNVYEHSATLIDYVFAHSEASAAILRKIVSPQKVIVTGTLRRSEKLPPNPDGDIVVCGQGGTINNPMGCAAYCREAFRVTGQPPDGPLLDVMREQVAHERRHYDLILETARALHARYGDRVKFRPHPGEDMQRYRDEPMPIETGGSFGARLKTAAVVVFVSGCGTGLEAADAGLPTVRMGSGGYGKSRDYGVPVETPDQAVSAVSDLLATHCCIGDTKKAFSPLTIQDTLHKVLHKYNYPMPFDVGTALAARKSPFLPHDIQRGKFPDTEDAEIERLAGWPVQWLAWNLWSLTPLQTSGQQSAA